jgi:non-heme chloroperoxidase
VPEIVAHSGLLKDTLVHVEDTGGSGRPVVLIHGWPLSSASWNGQLPALRAAGYRAVRPSRLRSQRQAPTRVRLRHPR